MRRRGASVFSEPQLDDVYDELPQDEGVVFATEYLPGQFDQRADSAAQCIQLMAQCERPIVRTALVYILKGNLSDKDVETLKKHVINPVERREASLEKPETLRADYALPETVAVMEGFTGYGEAELDAFRRQYGLAMDDADLAFCQKYFQSERRDPTLTEIRMIDTYWSDHCRHTTFLTEFTDVRFDDARVEKAYGRYLEIRAALRRSDRPVTLMDMATVGARYLKLTGALTDLDESEEINACTVKLDVETDKGVEKWLLLFKNETHNHPTEIEPFGGAATCIGGAIRDPLSGRGYVYQAMRVTGAADPTQPVENTIEGKLPQRMLTTTAAAGYSSYGNQIGLATGLVDEIYHPGYAAKRMEIGAVVGAAPAENVRRETPAPGDCVVLLGGRTGRDGCGGATGSSKSHTAHSLETCGAEVQKGNAPEERKLQRLFRNPEAAKAHQALQRLWRRRRFRGHRRTGRRAFHRLKRRAAQVRRPRRHRTGHFRIAGAHGRGARARRCGSVHGAGARGKPRSHGGGQSHRGKAAGDALERARHRRRLPRVFEFQRRAQAGDGAGGGAEGAFGRRTGVRGRPAGDGGRPQHVFPPRPVRAL